MNEGEFPRREMRRGSSAEKLLTTGTHSRRVTDILHGQASGSLVVDGFIHGRQQRLLGGLARLHLGELHHRFLETVRAGKRRMTHK